jgi:hypothetical protein
MGARLVKADQVDVDHRPQQPLGLTRLHPHQHQGALFPGRITREALRPLLPHIWRLECVG